MAIEVVFDSIPDTVEESEKQFFEESDGKFRFNLKKYEEHVKSPVLAKNKDLIDRLGKVKPVADKFKDVSDDEWMAYQEWKAKRADDDDDDKSDKDHKEKGNGKPDAKIIQAAIREEKRKWDELLKSETKTRDDQIAALEQRYRNKILEDKLGALGDEHGVIPKRKAAWMKQVRDLFTLEEDELVFLEGNQPSAKYDAEAAVRDVLFKAYDYFYEPREAGSGSGKNKQGTAKDPTGKTMKRSDWDKLTPAQREIKIKAGVTVAD